MQVDVSPKESRKTRLIAPSEIPSPRVLRSPKSFNHYILNLPATAITFLPAFMGLYTDQKKLFIPYTTVKLPMIHVYCFSSKSDDNKDEELKICNEISEQIKHHMRPGDPEKEGEVLIWDVRDVAPLKRMFCASFRLPQEVAFK